MAKQPITVQQLTSDVNLSAQNKLFVIEGDLDLGGHTVVFDKSSVILFRGGSLNNGTLSGVFHFEAPSYAVFGANLEFDKNIKMDVPYLNPVWFGAHADGVTDDSAAINRTIEVAEKVSIKSVLLCGDYRVDHSIMITKGNIWLRGSGALLREELFKAKKYNPGELPIVVSENDAVSLNRTSTIFCNPDVDCIVVEETVANPIRLSDLQLCSVTKVNGVEIDRSQFTNKGIHYRSEFNGPTWPVIFERCYFYGFDKAIYFSSSLQYCIHCLQITDCAFKRNNYCLDSKVWEKKKDDPDQTTLALSWSFIFENNRCHDNGLLLHFGVEKGLCRIVNNNCEGTLGVGSETDKQYAIDLEIGQKVHAIICHNHFEQNHTRLVKVVGFFGTDSKVTATDNNTDGMAGAYEKFNWSYFESVVLDTDLQSEANYCVFEKELNCARTYNPLIQNAHSTVLLKDFGVWYWDFAKKPVLVTDTDFYLKPEFCRTDANGVTNPTVEWVETPLGRRKMAKYVKQEINFINIFGRAINYHWADNKDYLNLEVPFFWKGANGFLLNCYLRAGYTGARTDYDAYSDFNAKILSNKNGMFRLRITGKLWDKVKRVVKVTNNEVEEDVTTEITDSNKASCHSIYLHLGILEPAPTLGITECVWLGPTSILLTEEPLPLNYSIIENIDVP